MFQGFNFYRVNEIEMAIRRYLAIFISFVLICFDQLLLLS